MRIGVTGLDKYAHTQTTGEEETGEVTDDSRKAEHRLEHRINSHDCEAHREPLREQLCKLG